MLLKPEKISNRFLVFTVDACLSIWPALEFQKVGFFTTTQNFMAYDTLFRDEDLANFSKF